VVTLPDLYQHATSLDIYFSTTISLRVQEYHKLVSLFFKSSFSLDVLPTSLIIRVSLSRSLSLSEGLEETEKKVRVVSKKVNGRSTLLLSVF
jgi:hypothetical protein